MIEEVTLLKTDQNHAFLSGLEICGFQEAVCKKIAFSFSNVTPMQESMNQTTYRQHKAVLSRPWINPPSMPGRLTISRRSKMA
jgi:hypothetical protein